KGFPNDLAGPVDLHKTLFIQSVYEQKIAVAKSRCELLREPVIKRSLPQRLARPVDLFQHCVFLQHHIITIDEPFDSRTKPIFLLSRDLHSLEFLSRGTADFENRAFTCQTNDPAVSNSRGVSIFRKLMGTNLSTCRVDLACMVNIDKLDVARR